MKRIATSTLALLLGGAIVLYYLVMRKRQTDAAAAVVAANAIAAQKASSANVAAKPLPQPPVVIYPKSTIVPNPEPDVGQELTTDASVLAKAAATGNVIGVIAAGAQQEATQLYHSGDAILSGTANTQDYLATGAAVVLTTFAAPIVLLSGPISDVLNSTFGDTYDPTNPADVSQYTNMFLVDPATGKVIDPTIPVILNVPVQQPNGSTVFVPTPVDVRAVNLPTQISKKNY